MCAPKFSMRGVACLVAGLGAAPMALAGPDWVEIGDAGDKRETAQAPTPPQSGPLTSIRGSLGGRGVDMVDAYIIGVSDPLSQLIRSGLDPAIHEGQPSEGECPWLLLVGDQD